MLYGVGYDCYLRPDQFLDHLTVIKRQGKVINADSAFIFFIIHLIRQNGQNDQVGQSGQGGQTGKDGVFVIWSGVAWSILVWCGVIKSGLVWSGQLTRIIWIQSIEFDGFTEDSYGIHAYINILDKCEMSHGRTDGHTVERRVVFCLCRIRNRSYIKLPLTPLLSFNLLQTLFPRAAPQDQKTSPTKLLDKCSSKSLRVKCTLMHFFLYRHWAASQSYTCVDQQKFTQ